MPKETFFNLPAEKRDLIIKVVTDEFAAFNYEQASVNRIVTNAGISKGSLYQYFEDKRDIYQYLIDLMTKEKVKYVSPVMQNPEDHDIFTLIRELYVSGLRFVLENPKFGAIGKRFMEIKNSVVYDEIMHGNRDAANQFFRILLEKAVDKGEIRSDLDIPMFAYMIGAMNTQMIEYFTDFETFEDDDKLLETVDIFIEFLKNGIEA
ncbi:MAG: TetR/AcrR family transcriptional regulator [Chloroflexi bacterium]|jgi:AcrR family transcriptional regulator|nr:TetR/AcrR family transcriptional regulator [Chloroflexota bacterium]MBT3670254.1 TetR/AcrR family transcriptional regulator [Chloroflexota bacterium]MBT4003149.1 TetR/AcrR family transcriptional regulator [Chloroflexota bacterium]MBT4306073.1 TetR/AcrR family transcriptional regulator [Chloroflexota bacterium]MBT4534452.1 TetR/AcrR family transcriptional regulator [Chloroflexota bacterium]